MRILFVDQFSSLGGGQQCLRESIKAVIALGWTAHVGLPGDGPLVNQLRQLAASVHSIPLGMYEDSHKSAADAMRFAAELPRLTLCIRNLMRLHSIDLVYVNGPRVLPAAALATKRIIFHTHNRLTATYAKALARSALRFRSAPIIASSDFVASPFARWPERVKIVYNGVPDFGFMPQRHGDGPPCIGIIGRVAPEKGHLDFLDAARSLPGCRFLICGDGQHSGADFATEIRRRAEGLPVEFVPWQPDVRAVLQRLDLLTVPSNSLDATPRVIPEALSVGVPVLAYRSGGIPEVLAEGAGGIFTPAANSHALAQRITELVASPDRLLQLRQDARRAFEQRFTLDRYAKAIGSVLESAVTRPMTITARSLAG